MSGKNISILCSLLIILGLFCTSSFGFLDASFLRHLAQGFGLFGIASPPVDDFRLATTSKPEVFFNNNNYNDNTNGREIEEPTELTPRKVPIDSNRFRYPSSIPPWIRSTTSQPLSHLVRFEEDFNYPPDDRPYALGLKSDDLSSRSVEFGNDPGGKIGGNNGNRNGRSRGFDRDEYFDTNDIEKQIKNFENMLDFEMSQKIAEGLIRPFITSNSLFPDMSVFKELFEWGQKSTKKFAICNACRVSFGLLRMKARGGASLESIIKMSKFSCSLFRLSSTEVCNGLIDRFAPVLHYIVLHREHLTPEAFCGLTLQSHGCGIGVTSMEEWNIDLNQFHRYGVRQKKKRQIEFNRDRDNIENAANIPNKVKILQFTDLHIDLKYQPGSNAKCENELCCRGETRGFIEKATAAGFYGDLMNKCDIPVHSLQIALSQISKSHGEIGLIYMTGDLVPHNVWSSSKEENIQIITSVSGMLKSALPHTKIIPVIGNHETEPVNLFSPYGVHHNLSTEWVYSATARAWAQWIPRNQMITFLQGGYYSMEISPRFRVIVLNTNLCYTYNFWLNYESRDPSGQLQWLASELSKAEDRNMIVHILGHVPPGSPDCYTVWSRNYYRIISRFRQTVKGQFFGHTHYDEFKLYYDPEDRETPIAALFNGPSLTTYTRLNPGYKIYTVDGGRAYKSTWEVLDFETWIYNLVEANAFPARLPRWYRLYRATEAFNLPNTLPHSLNKLVNQMARNQSVYDTYLRLYHKASDVSLTANSGCDRPCRKKILCNMMCKEHDEMQICIDSKTDYTGEIVNKKNFDRAVLQSILNRPSISPEFNFFG